MKKLQWVCTTALMMTMVAFQPTLAQDVDEILDNYFENTGGRDAWAQLKGIKMMAKVNQGGVEIPLEIVQLVDGRTYTRIDFQGQVFMQGVFDGTTLWGHNIQTMAAEKSDDETTQIIKLNANDFPDSFFDYQTKGYTVELQGTETIEGAETFKIKLVKEPMTIEGEQVEDISYFFFDTENFVPIYVEKEVPLGPQKGAVQTTTLSDYQEVDGLYFPFSIAQGIKGGPSQPLSLDSIELNPEVDDSVFLYPGTNIEEEKK